MKAVHSVASAAFTLVSAAMPTVADPLDDCADTRATQVDARTESIGDSQRCGFGVSLFGIGGGIFGPKCPDKKATYPSHQECLGEDSPRQECVPEGHLPVTVEDCECSRATVLGTGFLLPSCACSGASDAGHIEDARTEACPPTILDPRKF